MTDENRDKDWSKLAEEILNEDISAENAEADDVNQNVSAEESDTVAGILEHPDYQSLQLKMTQTEQALNEQQDKYLRLASDMENLRRRAENDKIAAHKYGVQKLCEDLLPVIDSLEQALLAAEQAEGNHVGLTQGVQLTLNILNDTLGKYSVTTINPELGTGFDPHQHEAMSMVPSNDMAPNSVMVVFQKGYKIHDRIIRPARVVVSKAVD